MKAKSRLAFFLIVLFQVLVLVGMIAFNEVALANGQSVVLQTVPVDPRDMFRGDYVVLRYKISTVQGIAEVWSLNEGDTAYVKLEKRGDVWEAVAVSKITSERDKWQTYITGKITRESNDVLTIEYGIEQYFVPEGQGLAIQNARDLKVQARLSPSGKAVIEHLIVDGKIFQIK